ncbi:hypothetical protein D3C76_1567430 [compost metagenome]
MRLQATTATTTPRPIKIGRRALVRRLSMSESLLKTGQGVDAPVLVAVPLDQSPVVVAVTIDPATVIGAVIDRCRDF